MNKIIVDPRSYDFSNGYLTKLMALADRAIAGSFAYGFSAADAAFCYEFGGKQEKYANLSVKMVSNLNATDKAAIKAGSAPSIATDSYLYAGPSLESRLLPLDWCGDFMSDELKADLLAFGRQTNTNIYNPTQAMWGSKLHKWSGWSNNDPENNYYFSFFLATALVALVDPEGPWLAYIKNTMMPRIEAFYLSSMGGGSGEGTGYGEALARLYRVTRLLKDSAGLEFPGVASHARDTIHYMVHASKPGLKKLANIGDQSREADNKIDDPDEIIVLEAIAISSDDKANALGRWWLENNGEALDRTDLFRFACLSQRGERAEPTEFVYLAKSVGDLFAKTSHTDALASWIAVKCGRQNQTHAHRAQGELTLHSGGLSLAETQNARSRTGINQGSEYKNILLFKDENGVKVEQNRTGIGSLAYELKDGFLIITANASDAYSNIKWTRTVKFQNGIAIVNDVYSAPVGYKATHQINTTYQPVIDGNTVRAGNLKVEVTSDHAGIRIVDWKAVNATENPNGGWKIEIDLKGPLTTEWIDTAVVRAPFPMSETPNDPIKELEAQIVLLNIKIAELNASIEQQNETLAAYSKQIDEQAGMIKSMEERHEKIRFGLQDLLAIP